MGALNDALPSLYRLALDTYNSEGDDVVTRIDQLNTQEKNAQAQYSGAVGLLQSARPEGQRLQGCLRAGLWPLS